MNGLLEQLLSATEVRQVTDFLLGLQNERRIAWRPVGQNDNNLATINLGSDPASGLIERITNAFDAILELEWLKRGQPAYVVSPRSAVAQWFGIPDGRLSNVSDLRDASVATLADRVQVLFHDSERPDRPTVDVRDTGIGISGPEFDETILSLHKSRKLRKLFLAGAFGQGGSTALAYSPFTIIISKPHWMSQAGSSVQTAFTIVRFNSGDPDVDKHGLYEYLVDHATGHALEIGDTPEFSAGTLVRHISMELGKYRNIITAPTGSPWFLTHNYLFDPVLPFRLVEERKNGVSGERRTVSGNFRLLCKGDNTEYQRRAVLTFRGGRVSISWWVLSGLGESARNRITQYVLPSKPIVITYNGQKQGDFPNTVIKNDLKLPYLERYLVAHVDCDNLDNEARRQLFPTTREALRDTPIGDDLRRLVIDTLEGDTELKRLDYERKQRYLQRSDDASVENIRRRLSNRVRSIIKTAGGGKGPRVAPPEPTERAPKPPPIPMQEPPTFLEISSPNPRKVYAGRSFTIRFRTDADPAYFLQPETFVSIIDPPEFGQYSGTTNVRDGYGVAYFVAAETVEVGSEAKITLELRPRRAPSINAEIVVQVAPLPAAAGPGDGEVATPNINPQWVSEGAPFWIDNSWDRTSVAKVVQGSDSVEIYVSAENEMLSALIARAQRRGTQAVDAIRAFYLEHISFYAFLESIDQAPKEGGETDAPNKPEQNRELQRACDTLCGILEQIFEIIVSTAVDVEYVAPAADKVTGAEAA